MPCGGVWRSSHTGFEQATGTPAESGTSTRANDEVAVSRVTVCAPCEKSLAGKLYEVVSGSGLVGPS
jgi:hypothetical protein